MRNVPSRMLAVAAAIAASTVAARAQWATFQDQTATRLVANSALGSADPQEKDYAWADFDQDGDIDLVVVRKSPATTAGHFPNVLFMNENGVLTDRTAALASASLVAGSQGMLDATNDRDVVVVDVNGDGWADLVTCTTLTAGQPQHIRVPRVYINRGNNLGVWQGFLYDDALRINDTIWNGDHRFCSVAAGDVDNDGDQDLYFGDYQQGGARPADIDDRLLLNNGAGYFADVTSARMTAEMVESSFAMKVAMVDMNLDGKLDIVKDDALNAPQGISISYNNGAGGPGFFGTYQVAYGNAPYHFHISDLNNDNLPDMIVSDDGQDRYILHTGVVNGQATFGPTIAFTYTGGGGDDGFGGNNIIADLNNDGWKDAIIADFDVDVDGCGRRCHIFRNLGNAPNVTLQEEQVGSSVVGIPTSMLTGTFDVAVFDINGDGWKDMVIGRCSGTQVWINQPPAGMTFQIAGGPPQYIAPGAPRQIDVTCAGIGVVVPQAGTGRLHYSINNAPFTSVAMTDTGPGQFRGTLPAMPNCADGIRWYVAVGAQGGATYTDPPTAPGGFYSATAAVGLTPVYASNFEKTVTGWAVVNTALTTGAWQIATPIGTTLSGQFAAPPEDRRDALLGDAERPARRHGGGGRRRWRPDRPDLAAAELRRHGRLRQLPALVLLQHDRGHAGRVGEQRQRQHLDDGRDRSLGRQQPVDPAPVPRRPVRRADGDRPRPLPRVRQPQQLDGRGGHGRLQRRRLHLRAVPAADRARHQRQRPAVGLRRQPRAVGFVLGAQGRQLADAGQRPAGLRRAAAADAVAGRRVAVAGAGDPGPDRGRRGRHGPAAGAAGRPAVAGLVPARAGAVQRRRPAGRRRPEQRGAHPVVSVTA